MSKIKKESMSHDVLRLAKMMKSPIDIDTVRKVYGYIDRNSKVERSFETLFKRGLVDVTQDGRYVITKDGVDLVYAMAEPFRKIKDSHDDI